MDGLLNALKAHSGAQDASAGQPRFATVTSVDPAHGTVRVQLQPEGVLTGWLPLLSPWVGAGWGMSCPPSPGDQVLVLPQEGDAEHGVVAGRSWSQGAASPATPVGELWLTAETLLGQHVLAPRVVTAAGAVAILPNDGLVKINKTVGGATGVTLEANPVAGTVHVIKDGKGDAATNNITITAASGTIDGAATFVINQNRGAVTLQFDGSEWSII